MKKTLLSSLAWAVFAVAPGLGAAPAALNDAALASVVDRRIAGDRTGACLAVAVIDGDAVARAFRCARAADSGRIDATRAFEIGSVSKPMTATLLAQLVVDGKAKLDDPLVDYLPAGSEVPAFQGQPITLRHLVTHSSGLPALPASIRSGDAQDPYAALTPDILLRPGRQHAGISAGQRARLFQLRRHAVVAGSGAAQRRRPGKRVSPAVVHAVGNEGRIVARAPRGRAPG